MKAVADKSSHIVAVIDISNVVEAGHLGFTFAQGYPHLVKDGWRLHFYGAGYPHELSRELREKATPIESASDIVTLMAYAGRCPECGRS